MVESIKCLFEVNKDSYCYLFIIEVIYDMGYQFKNGVRCTMLLSEPILFWR